MTPEQDMEQLRRDILMLRKAEQLAEQLEPIQRKALNDAQDGMRGGAAARTTDQAREAADDTEQARRAIREQLERISKQLEQLSND